MIKKRNKQQSLAGRIDKLGGPEFENHWYSGWQDEKLTFVHIQEIKYSRCNDTH